MSKEFTQAEISRRRFVGLMGGASLSLPGSHAVLARGNNSATSHLVEMAHLANRGGWKLDTQFHNVLGFSYLLAHGMGHPVADAATAVTLPARGRYHVWVHAKDWCPGDWEAPGRFKVVINGRELPEVFGTRQGWGWQSGGVIDVVDEKIQLKLRDLTGFEGRCSAIYFSQDEADEPPADGPALLEWRMNQLGVSGDPVEVHDFDVVIAGGGITGCAAALAAESQGLEVALIHNRPLLGGNASSEIRVHTLGIHGRAGHILSKIDTEHYPNGSARALKDQEKRRVNMAGAKGVRQFLLHTLIDVEVGPGTIKSVLSCAIETGAIHQFRAPVYIDCTGDGWMGEMAGAKSTYGRESRQRYNEGWEMHGDLWSPEEPDNRVMGTSVLWNVEKTDRRVPFPDVPWAAPVSKAHTSPHGGEWYWEYSDNDLNQIDDAESIRDHMFRAIYGTYANTIRQPKYGNLKLKWVSFNGGKRESRRLIGDHLFTGVDARDSVEFPDTVVTEKRDIDVHYQTKLKGDSKDFISKALFQKPANHFYFLPFRSLYSVNVGNLMMAGRCFSCTHVGLGGPRVMNTCGQMGAATGYAAALCKKHGVRPRIIGKEHITELRELCGYTLEDPKESIVRIWKPGQAHRFGQEGPKAVITSLPDELSDHVCVSVSRGASGKPGISYTFAISAPAVVYLTVHDRGGYTPPQEWEKTSLRLTWADKYHDTVYKRAFGAGEVVIPGHQGKSGPYYGVPHAAFLKGKDIQVVGG